MVCFMLPGLAHAGECVPKTQPQPQPTVTVTSSQELIEAIRAAHGNGPKSIHLRAGTYRVPKRGFVIRVDGLNIQGEPGQRDKTVIRGDGMRGNATHVFLVQGKNFQVAHLTLGWVKHHVVQVQGERGASSPRFFDVAFINAGQQLFKVTGHGGNTADQGVIRNSLFEFPGGVAAQGYTGGIDAHRAADWIIEGNVFRHIRSPDSGLAEHAIHFWNGSRGTIVRYNKIFNADRGIGFGLGQKGHQGGIIANNFIHVSRDVGIGLESSPGTKVIHNTVFVSNGYPNAIEYRFNSTRDVLISGNLTNAAIRSRNDGNAVVEGNVDYATRHWFKDALSGDLHLDRGIPDVTKARATLPEFLLDVDCEHREPGGPTDIGADHSPLAPDAALEVPRPSSLDRALAQIVGQWQRLESRLAQFNAGPPLWKFALFGGVVFALITIIQLWLLMKIFRRTSKIQKDIQRITTRKGTVTKACHIGLVG